MLKIIIPVFIIATYVIDCKAQSKEVVTNLLETYCIEHYDSCFTGRQYIVGSLSVDACETDTVTDAIKVKGRHSYKGIRIPFVGRKIHSSVFYRAEIKKTEDKWLINFHKWNDDMQGAWENCQTEIMIQK